MIRLSTKLVKSGFDLCTFSDFSEKDREMSFKERHFFFRSEHGFTLTEHFLARKSPGKMRSALAMLAIAMTAHSCTAFAPAAFAPAPALLPASSSLRAPLTGLRVSHAALVRDRLKGSLEFAVTKIFPAGAGWQGASIMAGSLGIASTSLAFFATMGLGNLLGVFLGHFITAFWKKTMRIEDAALNLKGETEVAMLLSGAAFCSGAAWQPALNAMHSTGFAAALLGVNS